MRSRSVGPSVPSAAVLVLAIAAIVASGTAAATGGGRVVVAKEMEGDIALESVALAEGETRVFEPGEIITVLLPYAVGTSGDLLLAKDRKNSVSVTCADGVIRTTVSKDDGTNRALPDVAVADLGTYDLRVNVTSGSGLKRAFFVSGYGDIEAAPGPVMDMFAGAVELAEGEYSITTEVSPRAENVAEPIGGAVPLLVREGSLLIDGRAEGGGEGHFVVDFGSGATLVAREFLPEGSEIEPVLAIEYSTEGERVLPGTMTGAGGYVESFLGATVLDRLTFGGVVLDGFSVRVIEDMSDLENEGIVGIVGLDLLEEAGVASVTLGQDGTGELRLLAPSEADDTAGVAIELPFTMAAGHIFIEGSLREVPVSFLFDTGARSTIVPLGLAERAGLERGSLPERDFRGLDGSPLPARSLRADGLSLAGEAFAPFDIYAADLPVLEGLGLEEGSGLLGIDFVLEFSRFDVDFSEHVLRLWR